MLHGDSDMSSETAAWGQFALILERSALDTGNDSHLDESMAIAQKWMMQSQPRKHLWLSHFASTLRLRFHRKGSLDDLNEAIRRLREAIRLVPADKEDHLKLLLELAVSLLHRYYRLEHITDLDEAIQLSRAAIAPNPPSPVDGMPGASYLSEQLLAKYSRDENIQDLEESIELLRISDTHSVSPSEKATGFRKAAEHYRALFLSSQLPYHLDLAIQAAICALNLVPKFHTDMGAHNNTAWAALSHTRLFPKSSISYWRV